MRILHILDHGLPLHSGYAFRTRAIVKAQLARGWEVACLTGPRHDAPGPDPEIVDGITFYRTPRPAPAPAPLGEWREIRALSARLDALDPRLEARPAPRPFAGADRARRLAGGAAPRSASGLRDPRLLGGCLGRQRHRARRLAQISPDPDARNPCRAPGGCGRGDLRGAARRSDRARHRRPTRSSSSPNGVDLNLFGNPPVAGPRLRPQPRPRRCRYGRLHRLLLRL